jgi:hypothetical protein
MMTLDELTIDMASRVGLVVTVEPDDAPAGASVESALTDVGLAILGADGSLLGVEFGLDDDGGMSVSVRKFAADGSAVEPVVFSLGVSVLISD